MNSRLSGVEEKLKNKKIKYNLLTHYGNPLSNVINCKIEISENNIKNNQIFIKSNKIISLFLTNVDTYLDMFQTYFDFLKKINRKDSGVIFELKVGHCKTTEESLDVVGDKLNEIINVLYDKINTNCFILSNTLNLSHLGSDLNNFAYIWHALSNKSKEKIRFCLNTQYLTANGYDISNYQSLFNFFNLFENKIGLRYLKVIIIQNINFELFSKKYENTTNQIGFDDKCLELIKIISTYYNIYIIFPTNKDKNIYDNITIANNYINLIETFKKNIIKQKFEEFINLLKKCEENVKGKKYEIEFKKYLNNKDYLNLISISDINNVINDDRLYKIIIDNKNYYFNKKLFNKLENICERIIIIKIIEILTTNNMESIKKIENEYNFLKKYKHYGYSIKELQKLHSASLPIDKYKYLKNFDETTKKNFKIIFPDKHIIIKEKYILFIIEVSTDSEAFGIEGQTDFINFRNEYEEKKLIEKNNFKYFALFKFYSSILPVKFVLNYNSSLYYKFPKNIFKKLQLIAKNKNYELTKHYFKPITENKFITNTIDIFTILNVSSDLNNYNFINNKKKIYYVRY